MKALVYDRYGSPDELRLVEMDRPAPKDDEVLIKLHATSVNLSDWEYLTGKPAYARINGLFRPRNRILGSDIAGVVEATGAKVTKLKPGDAVFGDILQGLGGFAEYTCAREDQLLHKPDALSFEQAAAIPQAGVIALQGIRDKGQVGKGQKVLINGAGGGTGSFAIPIAKHFGAEVTGVDNAHKLDLMRCLGADHVLDYRQQDFTTTGARYDLILDPVASRSAFACRRALEPGGRYLAVGGPVRTILNLLIVGGLISLFGSRKIGILGVHQTAAALAAAVKFYADAAITPSIDRCFPLEKTAEAIAYHGEGKARGKIVITM